MDSHSSNAPITRPASGLIRILRTRKKSVSYVLLALAFGSLGLAFDTGSTKLTGTLAWYMLVFIALLGPLVRLTHNTFLMTLVGFRKEFGIIMGCLALAHASILFRLPSLLADVSPPIVVGKLALLLTIPLLFTSNTWSMRLLKKWWKRLHTWLMPLLIITAGTHAMLLSHEYLTFGLPLGVYGVVKILEIVRSHPRQS